MPVINYAKKYMDVFDHLPSGYWWWMQPTINDVSINVANVTRIQTATLLFFLAFIVNIRLVIFLLWIRQLQKCQTDVFIASINLAVSTVQNLWSWSDDSKKIVSLYLNFLWKYTRKTSKFLPRFFKCQLIMHAKD